VLAVGVSNFTVAQVAALESFLTIPLSSTQPEFSLFHTDPLWDGSLDAAMVRITPCSLGRHWVAGGSAMGKARSRSCWKRRRRKRRVGGGRSLCLADGAPGAVIPIVGSQRVERIVKAPSVQGRVDPSRMVRGSPDGDGEDAA